MDFQIADKATLDNVLEAVNNISMGTVSRLGFTGLHNNTYNEGQKLKPKNVFTSQEISVATITANAGDPSSVYGFNFLAPHQWISGLTANAWLKIDVGAQKYTDKLVFYTRNQVGTINIEVSNDNLNWTSVYNGAISGIFNSYLTVNGTQYSKYAYSFATESYYRYVRLTVIDLNGNSITLYNVGMYERLYPALSASHTIIIEPSFNRGWINFTFNKNVPEGTTATVTIKSLTDSVLVNDYQSGADISSWPEDGVKIVFSFTRSNYFSPIPYFENSKIIWRGQTEGSVDWSSKVPIIETIENTALDAVTTVLNVSGSGYLMSLYVDEIENRRMYQIELDGNVILSLNKVRGIAGMFRFNSSLIVKQKNVSSYASENSTISYVLD